MFRETRRERILDNRAKAMLVAEKQKSITEKREEEKKKNEEEMLAAHGCPKLKAEKNFYETIARIKKEREAKTVEEKQLKKHFPNYFSSQP